MDAIRSELVEHHRQYPERGGLLRAPLRTIAEMWQLLGRPTPAALAARLGLPMTGDKIVVDAGVEPDDRVGLLEGIRIAGLLEQPAGNSGETVRLLASAPDLPRLAGIPGVRWVVTPPSLRLATVSEGERTTGADLWQRFSPFAGLPLARPVRVAVIDGGFAGYESLLGSELPNSVGTAAFCGLNPGDVHGCGNVPPIDHGTAVAEILHDMSPNAEMLLIAIDLLDDVSRPSSAWRQALDYASSQGADIVSTSLGTIWNNRDGRSPLCTSAHTLAQNHILWTSSAGNDGDPCDHEHYPFVNSKMSPGFPYGSYQSFVKGKDPILNEVTLPPGGTHYVALTWNSWNGPPTDDFDLFYVCDFGAGYQLVAVSEDSQCGASGARPYEAVGWHNTTGQPLACAYGVVEFDPAHCRHSAIGVQFDTWSYVDLGAGVQGCAELEEATSSYTIAHPADCPDVEAAGAVCVHNGQLESFSSQGPTLDARVKPDLCAPDSVSTATYGPSLGCYDEVGGSSAGFPGTSASTPHLAGALALLYEKIGGSFTPEQCRAILDHRAVATGGGHAPDNHCGHGTLCLNEGGCD